MIALLAIGLLAAAFSAGRFSAPEQVRERVEYRTLDLKTEDIVRGMTFAREVQVTRWRNVVTTITAAPDAGTVTTITDRTIEHEGASEQLAATETITKVERVEVEKIREKEITIRPRFAVSLLVGISIERPWITLTGPLVLGFEFDVRIFGGFSLGLWLNTFGAFGGAGRLEF